MSDFLNEHIFQVINVVKVVLTTSYNLFEYMTQNCFFAIFFPSGFSELLQSDKGKFTRYDLSGRFCSRSVINLSFSTISSLKLLHNNISNSLIIHEQISE